MGQLETPSFPGPDRPGQNRDRDMFLRIFSGRVGSGIKISVRSGSGYFLPGIMYLSENFGEKVELNGSNTLHSLSKYSEYGP